MPNAPWSFDLQDDDIPVIDQSGQSVTLAALRFPHKKSPEPAAVAPTIQVTDAKPADDVASVIAPPSAPVMPPPSVPLPNDALPGELSVRDDIADKSALASSAAVAEKVTSMAGPDEDAYVALTREIAATVGDVLGDETLQRRFRMASELHFRGLRDELETKSKFTMPIVSGGLGWNDDQAERVLQVMERHSRAQRGEQDAVMEESKRRFVEAQLKEEEERRQREAAAEQERLDRLYGRLAERAGVKPEEPSVAPPSFGADVTSAPSAAAVPEATDTTSPAPAVESVKAEPAGPRVIPVVAIAKDGTRIEPKPRSVAAAVDTITAVPSHLLIGGKVGPAPSPTMLPVGTRESEKAVVKDMPVAPQPSVNAPATVTPTASAAEKSASTTSAPAPVPTVAKPTLPADAANPAAKIPWELEVLRKRMSAETPSVVASVKPTPAVPSSAAPAIVQSTGPGRSVLSFGSVPEQSAKPAPRPVSAAVVPPPNLPTVAAPTATVVPMTAGNVPPPVTPKPSTPVMAAVAPAPAPSPMTPPSRSPSASTPEKPTMSDVRSGTHLVGPVEELRNLTVADFRRLSRDPHEATLKIRDKIDLLAETSFETKTAGVKAWQESEANRAYLDLLRLSLEGKPILDVITDRTAKKEPVLTKAEFDAIMDLNRKIRFGQ